MFSAQVEAFRFDYRLLLIDLAGHGGSSHQPGPYGPEEYAAGVSAAMDAAGIRSCHFWGTHTGASVGLLLAARSRGRIRSLVLEGAVVPGIAIASVAAGLARAKSTVRERGLGAAREEWFQASPWFQVIRANPERCRADAHWAIVSAFAGGPWLDERSPRPVATDVDALLSVPVPTLLVNGEHEVADFLPTADRLAACLPDVQRRVIAEAGGFPLWEFPDRVNPEVAAFLRQRLG